MLRHRRYDTIQTSFAPFTMKRSYHPASSSPYLQASTGSWTRCQDHHHRVFRHRFSSAYTHADALRHAEDLTDKVKEAEEGRRSHSTATSVGSRHCMMFSYQTFHIFRDTEDGAVHPRSSGRSKAGYWGARRPQYGTRLAGVGGRDREEVWAGGDRQTEGRTRRPRSSSCFALPINAPAGATKNGVCGWQYDAQNPHNWESTTT